MKSTISLAGILFWGLGFATTAKTAEQNSKIVEIPFTNVCGLIFFEVKINGTGPMWFNLDTGFDVNVLSSNWVEPLKLTLTNEQEVKQPGGTVKVGEVPGVSVELPGFTMENIPFSTIPLSVSASIFGRPTDGILGDDFIKRFVVEIDYDASLLRLHQAESFTYNGPGKRVLVQADTGEPFVEGKILLKGREPIHATFKIDTGSTDVVGFNKNYIQDNAVLKNSGKTFDARGSAVGGDTEGILFKIDGVIIDEFMLEKPVVGATLSSGGFENRPDSGTIGAGLLSHFKLWLDFSRNQMFVEKGALYGQKPGEDKFGVWLFMTGGKNHAGFQPYTVLMNSPAAEAGIQKGDIFIAIDGRPASDWTLNDLWQLIRGKEGEKHVFIIERDGKTLTKEIELKHFF